MVIAVIYLTSLQQYNDYNHNVIWLLEAKVKGTQECRRLRCMPERRTQFAALTAFCRQWLGARHDRRTHLIQLRLRSHVSKITGQSSEFAFNVRIPYPLSYQSNHRAGLPEEGLGECDWRGVHPDFAGKNLHVARKPEIQTDTYTPAN